MHNNSNNTVSRKMLLSTKYIIQRSTNDVSNDVLTLIETKIRIDNKHKSNFCGFAPKKKS
jgi:hypothetical protein